VAVASAHYLATFQHTVSGTHVAGVKDFLLPGTLRDSPPWHRCWRLMRELSIRNGGGCRLCDPITASSNKVTSVEWSHPHQWRGRKARFGSDSTTQGPSSSVENTRVSPLPHIKWERHAIVRVSASDTNSCFLHLHLLLLLPAINFILYCLTQRLRSVPSNHLLHLRRTWQ
jgi:hypothetical protein